MLSVPRAIAQDRSAVLVVASKYSMPIFFKLMNFEKVMGWELRYQID